MYGYKDWRIPTIKELLTLVDYSRYNPALPEGHPFYGVQIGNCETYLSSTKAVWNKDGDYTYKCGACGSIVTVNDNDIWIIWLGTGTVETGDMGDNYFLWPVRTERGHESIYALKKYHVCEDLYRLNNDVVLDASTGLMWARRADLFCGTYAEAEKFIEEINKCAIY